MYMYPARKMVSSTAKKPAEQKPQLFKEENIPKGTSAFQQHLQRIEIFNRISADMAAQRNKGPRMTAAELINGVKPKPAVVKSSAAMEVTPVQAPPQISPQAQAGLQQPVPAAEKTSATRYTPSAISPAQGIYNGTGKVG